ncbi:HTH-type transcriptional regulator BetI [Oxobacter pfennigii]|uniref:HTH-type transcriptional regulator BetI n=1 Tax=Oxobacter pfennigii TaxID=36849 RepID=A0A0P8W2D9_9CLOT|nr:TetR/AcrR family transcriptional regulator [Oxobacter pfennigii]KPU42690.1 HTH-type transcriptional regulator BetI [Oxobacter pfennigii]
MKQDIKRKIINATIKLIEEKANKPEDVTVRDICKEAEVGLSQINYHFQTKENLIAQCIQEIIGNVISNVPRESPLLQGKSAAETLKLRMLYTLNFLYANENISRISILTDQHNARIGDNTNQTINGYSPLVEAVCRERNITADPKELAALMVFSLQGMFLRTDVVRDVLGIDLRSEAGRKKLADNYVETTFREV